MNSSAGPPAAPPAPPLHPLLDGPPFMLLGLASPWLLASLSPYLLVPPLALSLLLLYVHFSGAPAPSSWIAMGLQLMGFRPAAVRGSLRAYQVVSHLWRHLAIFVFFLVMSDQVGGIIRDQYFTIDEDGLEEPVAMP